MYNRNIEKESGTLEIIQQNHLTAINKAKSIKIKTISNHYSKF